MELLHGDKQEMGVTNWRRPMASGLTPKRFQNKTNTVRWQTFKPHAPGGAPQETTGNESSPRAR